jgi:hypothetical protein
MWACLGDVCAPNSKSLLRSFNFEDNFVQMLNIDITSSHCQPCSVEELLLIATVLDVSKPILPPPSI